MYRVLCQIILIVLGVIALIEGEEVVFAIYLSALILLNNMPEEA